MPGNPANNAPKPDRRLSVAPMMDWTDRHERYFLRQITARTLLYSEMITTGAILHGDRERLLGYDPCEHPLALQVGGADPEALSQCAEIAAAAMGPPEASSTKPTRRARQSRSRSSS